ncbi:MAG: 1-phosphofructokinase [Lachnospiraceae bacterium]
MILTVTLNAAIDKVYIVEAYDVGCVNRVKECKYSAGGKGLNVSRVATIAGAEVLATGFVGGHAGNYIVDTLNSEHVANDFIHVPSESRSCINIFDESKKEHTEFLEPGFTVDSSEITKILEKFEELVQICDVCVISGSVPKGADSRIYVDMIRIAKSYQKKILVDTSGQLLIDSVASLPSMIKPNTDEVCMITGKELNTEEDLIQAATRLYESGIELVVISRGSKGSLIVGKEGIYRAGIPEITPVNTVGCGDSMMAGYAVGMERGMKTEDMIRFASGVAAANALRPETGFIVMEDVEKLIPEIPVTLIQKF